MENPNINLGGAGRDLAIEDFVVVSPTTDGWLEPPGGITPEHVGPAAATIKPVAMARVQGGYVDKRVYEKRSIRDTSRSTSPCSRPSR